MDAAIKNVLDALALDLLDVLSEIDDADALTVYVDKSGYYDVLSISANDASEADDD